MLCYALLPSQRKAKFLYFVWQHVYLFRVAIGAKVFLQACCWFYKFFPLTSILRLLIFRKFFAVEVFFWSVNVARHIFQSIQPVNLVSLPVPNICRPCICFLLSRDRTPEWWRDGICRTDEFEKAPKRLRCLFFQIILKHTNPRIIFNIVMHT